MSGKGSHMTQPRAKLVAGPLEPYVGGFRAELETRGYSPWAAKLRVWLLVSLSSWLAAQGLTSGELTPGRVEQFVEERRVRRPERLTPAALQGAWRVAQQPRSGLTHDGCLSMPGRRVRSRKVRTSPSTRSLQNAASS